MVLRTDHVERRAHQMDRNSSLHNDIPSSTRQSKGIKGRSRRGKPQHGINRGKNGRVAPQTIDRVGTARPTETARMVVAKTAATRQPLIQVAKRSATEPGRNKTEERTRQGDGANSKVVCSIRGKTPKPAGKQRRKRVKRACFTQQQKQFTLEIARAVKDSIIGDGCNGPEMVDGAVQMLSNRGRTPTQHPKSPGRIQNGIIVIPQRVDH